MFEATSFEKIKTLKKWAGMQKKQFNGVCHFNILATFQRYRKKPKDQG